MLHLGAPGLWGILPLPKHPLWLYCEYHIGKEVTRVCKVSPQGGKRDDTLENRATFMDTLIHGMLFF